MKKYLYLLFAAIISSSMLFISCDDDDDVMETEGDLEITFRSTYDGQPLVFNETYEYADGQQIKFDVSEFYLSDMEMTGPVNLILADIFKVDFADINVDQSSSERGLVVTFTGIPSGTYSDLTMGIGVSPDLNAMTPSDFEPGHPLRDESNYWQPWNSFIFSKLEGTLDSLGSGAFDVTYVYHSGKDELYTEAEKDLSVEIRGGETTRLDFVIDHRELLFRGSEALDIKAKPTAHSAGDLAYPRYILENFEKAIQVELN